MEWVSVEDRLPEEICRCWCFIKEICELGTGYYQWNCPFNPAHGFTTDSGNVTHWMPLPQPPDDA